MLMWNNDELVCIGEYHVEDIAVLRREVGDDTHLPFDCDTFGIFSAEKNEHVKLVK